MSERVAWVNGAFVAEHDATVSIWDAGFMFGDAAFDTERTFNGKVFKLDEHLDRLWASCRYIDIEPPVTKAELHHLTLELVERNMGVLPEGEDYWVTQRFTRGVTRDGFPGVPTAIIDCSPLPFKARARYFRDGIPLVVSSVRRTPPWALSPRAKLHNYLNVLMAAQDVQGSTAGAWVLLLDEHGNVAEGKGESFFIVVDGVLYTPPEGHILPGISRQTVLDLAHAAGIVVREHPIDTFDLRLADEAFLSATSLCLCGVSSINGRPLRGNEFPGPVTRRLSQAFSRLVGLDVPAQYLRHLDVADRSGAPLPDPVLA